MKAQKKYNTVNQSVFCVCWKWLLKTPSVLCALALSMNQFATCFQTPSSAGPHVNQGAPAAPPGGAHALYPPAPGRHGNQASPQLPFPPPAPGGQQPGQPVEFNLAISYVNKIKVCLRHITWHFWFLPGFELEPMQFLG